MQGQKSLKDRGKIKMKVSRLIRCQEAGKLLGLPGSYVRQLENSGVLRAIRTPGNQRRFSEDDVLKFKRQHLEPKVA